MSLFVNLIVGRLIFPLVSIVARFFVAFVSKHTSQHVPFSSYINARVGAGRIEKGKDGNYFDRTPFFPLRILYNGRKLRHI